MIKAADAVTLNNCQITKQTHTKKRFQFFLATPENRAPDDTFKQLVETAKRHGGWYSRKWQDTPNGYAFKDKTRLVDFLEEAAPLLAQGEPVQPTAETETLDDLRSMLGEAPAPELPPAIGTDAEENAVADLRETAPQRSSAPNVDRWRKMAETCEKTAADCLRDRLTNTPKRLAQARSTQVTGYEAERMAEYLRAYADRAELGTLPHALQGEKLKKDDFSTAAKRKKQNTPNGYHSYMVETPDWLDTSPVSEALRQIAQDARTQGDAPAVDPDAQRAAQAKRDALEDSLRFTKHEGFFPTPDDLAQYVAKVAEIEPGHQVLEPSAGKGDLARAVRENCPTAQILCIEKNAQIAQVCALEFITITQDITDFHGAKFDRVVMNPPFENGQDIMHVCHCYENLLAKGGKLVAIVANGATLNKSQEWLSKVGAKVQPLPEGSFKNAFRSTGVNTALIVVDKP